ncbi:hypothetical protein CPC08DRAFT_608707, partial [Agrocybe pediades]
LPTEITLHIFTFLEVKPYIMSHSVCTEWNHLILLAVIHPIRERMVKLFRRMLAHPDFPKTRPWTLQNLKPFDREAYIRNLQSQYPNIPDEFRLWILEWPAKMAIFCMWPELPMVDINQLSFQLISGVNWLAYGSPLLLSFVYRDECEEAMRRRRRFIPALLVWRNACAAQWLLFDE